MDLVRTRIGLIVPANNPVIEPELWNHAPADTAFHATRILVKGDLTEEAVRTMESHVGRAVSELEATGVDVIAYADMVTSFVMDPGWNEARTRAVTDQTGIACVSAWTAMRDALTRYQPSGIGLVTPYPAELHALASPFFAANGHRIVADATLDIRSMSQVGKVSASQLTGFISRLDLTRADVLVILATDLPTFDVIDDLEESLGLPVLTSNQALLCAALKSAGRYEPISCIGGFGRQSYPRKHPTGVI